VSDLAVLAADPLLSGHIDGGVVLIVLIKTVVTFAIVLVSVLFMIWLERKVISDMQNRIGPNRAGPFGLLISVADGIKVFFKEDLLPEKADRRIFRLAPYLSAVPAFLSFAIVPIGGTIEVAGHRTNLQLVDPPIGILFLLAMSSVAVYGVMLAGWSSGSKYPLLGSVRASAQMVSYEAALGLSIASVVLVTGSLQVSDIVREQSGSIADLNLIRLGFVPFVIFLVAATAEINRPPFDLVEAEQELVGGYFTEYSGIRFALFYLAEFMATITMSAIMVTLFFGGPNGPGFDFLEWLWPILWFVGKVFLFLIGYIWLRATLPRLRYDQLMDLGWKVLIPSALAWLLILAALYTGEENFGGRARYLAVAIPIGIVAWAAFSRAMRVGRERAERGLQEVGD
jgi:NADH-quinone oxidoreductase subunit H